MKSLQEFADEQPINESLIYDEVIQKLTEAKENLVYALYEFGLDGVEKNVKRAHELYNKCGRINNPNISRLVVLCGISNPQEYTEYRTLGTNMIQTLEYRC